MSGYRELLRVQIENVSYDLGFHPEWDKLRLRVSEERYPEDGGPGSADIWLTPEQARALADALCVAADEMVSSE